MGFLDVLLGRTKPVAPNLDRLFALPGAAITLQASEGLTAELRAGVCFKPAAGQAFADTEKELTDLLDLGGADHTSGSTSASLSGPADEFGYRWVVVEATDFESLVTRVHVVNSTLQDHGYGPQLLCSVFALDPAEAARAGTGVLAKVHLVYLYKRGTFYPFVPIGGQRRDNEAELRLKNELAEDLAIEPDLDRWFPLWNLPFN